jgi:hypothetical protein
MTRLSLEPLVIPGARLGEENPLPYFRARAAHQDVPADATLPEDKRHRLGWETGFRVLPYRMQDQYTRRRDPLTFRSIVLENEILKATFLPEVGGRLISLLHKPDNHELLDRNPVFQPANLAIRNAWFSGGIEWNIGQYGHTFTTCAPLFAAAITGAEGEPGLRMYEYERCKQIFWQMDFYLPPGSPWLIAHTRAVNACDVDISTYWWTNIAVPEGEDIRVLAPTDKVLYPDFRPGRSQWSYGDMPHLPTFDGQDASYSLNATFASEFFLQCDETDMPWETALDQTGSGLIEASTAQLRYRKLFCWGSHPGGRHWQEFLGPGGRPYIEIQSGLAPTQVHGLSMPARADWHWTQIFGQIQADPRRAHDPDWNSAWRYVDGVLHERMTPRQLNALDAQYTQLADRPGGDLLQAGSGWGALEMARRGAENCPPIPPSFAFPEHTLGPEQEKWLSLLRAGRLPEQPPELLPGEWMVQEEWKNRLEAGIDTNRHWYALLHLGVMRMEHFDAQGAKAAWEESLALRPSTWAWRNLSVLAQMEGDPVRALDCLARAWEINSAESPSVSLAQEYLGALCKDGQFSRALTVYNSLPAALQNDDRVQILRARVALELGDWATVEGAMQREYAAVREGETELTDVWFQMWYRREAEALGHALDEAEKAGVRRRYPPPAQIDFRMF